MKTQQLIKTILILVFFSFIIIACPTDIDNDDRPLSNWTAVSNRVTDGSVRDIIFVNEKFIAVGGNIAISEDGKNWTSIANGIFGTFELDGLNYIIQRIGFGDGIYVACSFGGKIAWSEDLINWTDVAVSTFGENLYYASTGDVWQSESIRGITYGNGKFVAVGYEGRIAWSENGKDWTAVVNSPFNDTVWAVTFEDGIFLASGANKTFSSADGIIWQQVTNIPRFYSIAFGNGMFVYASSVAVKVAYGDGYFVAIGGHRYSGQIAWTEDGENWADVKNTTFGNEAIVAIAYGKGIFVVGGAIGKMAYSRPINHNN
jgi:hypothetical protein